MVALLTCAVQRSVRDDRLWLAEVAVALAAGHVQGQQAWSSKGRWDTHAAAVASKGLATVTRAASGALVMVSVEADKGHDQLLYC